MRGLLNVGGGVVFGRWLTGCVRDAAADYIKQRLLSGEYYEEGWEVNEIPPLQDRLLPQVNPVDQSSSLSAAVPSSKIKHARSQSQPKLTTRFGFSLQSFQSRPVDQRLAVVNLSESLTTSKPVAKALVFVPLELIKGLGRLPPRIGS